MTNWIRVEDRLPPIKRIPEIKDERDYTQSDPVWGWTSSGEPLVMVYDYEYRHFTGSGINYANKKITHWQPIIPPTV